MKNRLKMVSKVRNFWLCVFSGVVATTLICPIVGTSLLDNFGECLQASVLVV